MMLLLKVTRNVEGLAAASLHFKGQFGEESWISSKAAEAFWRLSLAEEGGKVGRPPGEDHRRLGFDRQRS